LDNKKFRDAFVSSRLSQLIAMQVKVLREEMGWTQAELAKKLGTSQNAVYRLENPRYGKHSISTLRKVASVFDVGLVVRFEPYSRMLNWVLSMDNNTILVPAAARDRDLIKSAEAPPTSKRRNVRAIKEFPAFRKTTGVMPKVFQRTRDTVAGSADTNVGSGAAESIVSQGDMPSTGEEVNQWLAI
jgi:transcriptional regulator with XRE-family HTH domain